MGPVQHAAGSDAANGASQLHGRDGDGSLTDADRDGLSGVPLAVIVL